jgi:HAMP domain-containing protein
MRLSLRAQLALAAVVVALVTLLVTGLSIQQQFRESLTEEVQLRGLTVARHLSGVAGDFLLGDEKLALANIAQGAREIEDVVYVRIVDGRGVLRAAAPAQALEVPFYPPNELTLLGPDESSKVQRYYNGRFWVQDVMVPIYVGRQRVGLVNVGMNEAAVDRAAEKIQERLLYASALALILGVGLALVLAVLLARPVEKLTRAVKDLGTGLEFTRVQASGPMELRRLEESFNQMSQRLEAVVLGTIQALARALAEHDQVSPGHADRVSRLAARTAKVLRLEPGQVEEISLAGLLIDIGHIGVPPQLLHKVDPLSDDELRRLRNHPQVGVRIIEPLEPLRPLLPLLMHHHERWDGRGYPLGLRGEAIPLGARILAVADAFDAMLTEKRHRKARSQSDAVRELQRCAGNQFDPRVVEAFVKQLTLSS